MMQRTLRRHWRSLPFLFAGALACLPVLALDEATATPEGQPPFRLVGQIVAGGGTNHARSPCFDLASTVAEPVAGRSAGADFILAAGFLGEAQSRDSLFRSSFESCQP